jgi:hypothetical protein
MKLNSTGNNPCGPLAGIRDRDRRPCEGSSQASATQPVVSARTASRRLFSVRARNRVQSRDADVRLLRPSLLYTFCAMPEHGPAILAHGCAMIFGSSRQYVKLLYTSQVAWRSTPMGIDRTNLWLRTILILFVLLGAPMAAHSDTLEDCAKELARKIAASLSARSDVSLGILNSSSLIPEDVARITEALKVELQSHGIGTPANGFVGAMVAVTLSESSRNFVWTAEIHMFDIDKVVLTTIPRPAGNRAVPGAITMTLRGEKFWEGPEQILDAAELTTPKDGKTLLLLQPDGLMIRKNVDGTSFKVEFPIVEAATRTPFGSIQNENACLRLEFSPCVVVNLESHICTIALETHNVVECHSEDTASARHFLQLRPTAQTFPRGRGELTEMSGHCGTQVRFAAGSGDYTQPDSVQAFEEQWSSFVPLSDELSFPGPVMTLHVTDRVPTAIVHNLQTGNYEAYRISTTCGG